MQSQPGWKSPLVLVIDSHRAVADVVARMLTHAGIESILAHGSRDAERVVRERGSDLNLVIAEVGGAHDCCAGLLQQLRRDRPALGLVCLTPHAHQLDAALSDLGLTRLMKPFTADDLREAVARLMAA